MTDTKGKVLIVEDEAPMLKILHDELEQAGFNPISATDGEQALGIALEAKPDLILLDILLPKENGLSMLKKLRLEGGDFGKNVPVIILTNLNPDSEEINKTITETNPTYYLVKADWTPSQIVEKIKDRLGIVG